MESDKYLQTQHTYKCTGTYVYCTLLNAENTKFIY